MIPEKKILEECHNTEDSHPQEKRGFLRGVRWAIREIDKMTCHNCESKIKRFCKEPYELDHKCNRWEGTSEE